MYPFNSKFLFISLINLFSGDFSLTHNSLSWFEISLYLLCRGVNNSLRILLRHICCKHTQYPLKTLCNLTSRVVSNKPLKLLHIHTYVSSNDLAARVLMKYLVQTCGDANIVLHLQYRTKFARPQPGDYVINIQSFCNKYFYVAHLWYQGYLF